MIDYPKSFKTTHSWKSCKMTCKTVRYFQIFSNIIQYCQILPDIAWYFTILSNIVLWCKYCFNLSNILKNVNKCSIFGILTSQYCWILSFIVRRCIRYLPIFCLKVFKCISWEKFTMFYSAQSTQNDSQLWKITSKWIKWLKLYLKMLQIVQISW